MAVTNLTGTKWVINVIPDITSGFIEYSINFTSNGNNYELLSWWYDEGHGEFRYGPPYTITVWTPMTNSWVSQHYRIIEITGGTAATNANLIAWLEANATQVPVVDLTNTTWSFDSSVVIENSNQVQDYAINYSLEVEPNQSLPTIFENGTSFEIETENISSWKVGKLKWAYRVIINTDYSNVFGDALVASNGAIFHAYTREVLSTYPQTLSRTDSFSGTYVKKIMISGGTDLSNPDLLAWLVANATYQEPIQSNTYSLTNTLTNLTKGNITLNLSADSDYKLPAQADITVTGGSIVSYNQSTGALVVTDNTTAVEVECAVQPTGYSGNITTYIPSIVGRYPYEAAIKFDAPPANENDYDAYYSANGIFSGLTSYTNKIKVYLWSPTYVGSVMLINNDEYKSSSATYNIPQEITLTGDYEIKLGYHQGSWQEL